MIKKTLSILLLSCLILFSLSCDNPSENDTTPPTVTIVYPQNNSVVSEIVTISCLATDNDGIDKLELWIDGVSTGIIDKTEPYSMKWNSTEFSNGTTHVISVRAYDKSENVSDSSPISVIVDNSNSAPYKINILSIDYNLSNMVISWEKSKDNDFMSYEILHSTSQSGDKSSVVVITDIQDTSYSFNEFDVTITNWYWIKVADSLGFSTLSEGYYIRDKIPEQANIKYIIYDDHKFYISWNKNNENDFLSYELFESLNQDMADESLVFVSNNFTDTCFVKPNIDANQLLYYRINVKDHWGLTSTSDIKIASSFLKIGFVSDRNGSGFYLMDILGNDPSLILPSSKIFEYQFSPDGNKLAYVINTGNNREILITDLFSTSSENITNSSGLEENIQFSPDGNKILYQYYVDGTRGYDIYTINIDGSNRQELTTTNNNDSNPIFSSDGSKIVFESGREHDNGIFVMNYDGSNQIRLTNQSGFKPRFSPNGSKITFMGWVNSGYDIFIINSDGTNLINLTNSDNFDYDPIFSPDGTKICFRSEVNNDFDIFIVDVDGTNSLNLTNSYGHDMEYQFSPDGLNILFQSPKEGDWDIFLVKIDGTSLINLTKLPDHPDIYPKFMPYE